MGVWGKNFDPEEHQKTILTARENRYYPSVDVYLPVCGEPTHLLDNTWQHVAALDYPNVRVHVLDDGAKEEVRQLARLHGFNCEFRVSTRAVYNRVQKGYVSSFSHLDRDLERDLSDVCVRFWAKIFVI